MNNRGNSLIGWLCNWLCSTWKIVYRGRVWVKSKSVPKRFIMVVTQKCCESRHRNCISVFTAFFFHCTELISHASRNKTACQWEEYLCVVHSGNRSTTMCLVFFVCLLWNTGRNYNPALSKISYLLPSYYSLYVWPLEVISNFNNSKTTLSLNSQYVTCTLICH